MQLLNVLLHKIQQDTKGVGALLFVSSSLALQGDTDLGRSLEMNMAIDLA